MEVSTDTYDQSDPAVNCSSPFSLMKRVDDATSHPSFIYPLTFKEETGNGHSLFPTVVTVYNAELASLLLEQISFQYIIRLHILSFEPGKSVTTAVINHSFLVQKPVYDLRCIL